MVANRAVDKNIEEALVLRKEKGPRELGNDFPESKAGPRFLRLEWGASGS